MLGLAAGLCALLSCVYGSILVYTQTIPHAIMSEYPDMPAEFGDEVPAEGVRGLLVEASPRDACTNISAPPALLNFTHKWIVLIARSNSACTFETQVRHAQAAGYHCAIVHNVNSSDLEVMTAADPAGIVIPSVFISDTAGLHLAAEYLYNSGFYIMVNNELPFNITTHLLLPFAVVVAVCLVIIVIFMIVKCIKDRRRSRRNRLPRRALDKILTWKYSKGDPYDTCAICLDDYREGERLRVLGCAHAYHSACVDPWLTQNKRVCPVCKRRVLVAGHDDDGASDSDAEPLLPRARTHHTQGGTFDEQNENPFARATRFVARLRASQQRNIQTPTSSEDEERPSADGEPDASERRPLVSESRARRMRRRMRRIMRLARARPAPTTTATAVTAPAPDPERGEIGVAALPAPSSVSL